MREGKPPNYSSLKPPFCPKREDSVIFGLREGGVGSYTLPPVQLYFHLTGLLTAVWHRLVSVCLKMKQNAYDY